ncbi:HSP20-like chaperone [Crucibulum laeve]|uniref:HSP20-like chaperone n=1 Tax=Crucibulum laeve TaxID=68775 RepID=A0A5C3M021_9AGAR|nr:HSP20-like chaperone [Crucibulum laeve]
MSFRFYEPFSDFDRLFDEAFNSRVGNNNQIQRGQSNQAGEGRNAVAPAFKPRMDLHENSETNTVTASFEFPGLKKEDIQIDLHNGRLTVSAESNISKDHDENGYAVRERRFGKFSRTLQLPQGIKDEEIKASMDNSVLTVTFPKSAPELAPKKISIA